MKLLEFRQQRAILVPILIRVGAEPAFVIQRSELVRALPEWWLLTCRILAFGIVENVVYGDQAAQEGLFVLQTLSLILNDFQVTSHRCVKTVDAVVDQVVAALDIGARWEDGQVRDHRLPVEGALRRLQLVVLVAVGQRGPTVVYHMLVKWRQCMPRVASQRVLELAGLQIIDLGHQATSLIGRQSAPTSICWSCGLLDIIKKSIPTFSTLHIDIAAWLLVNEHALLLLRRPRRCLIRLCLVELVAHFSPYSY